MRRNLLVLAAACLSLSAAVSAQAAIYEWPANLGGNGHSYEPVVAPGTWPQANAAAWAKGGYLATVTSAAEKEFVYGLIQDGAYWLNGCKGPWLGGVQPPPCGPEPAGGWTWVTNEPWSYTCWWPSQPDNAGGNQCCLCFEGGPLHGGAYWDDMSGTNIASGYIVEYEPAVSRDASSSNPHLTSVPTVRQRPVATGTGSFSLGARAVGYDGLARIACDLSEELRTVLAATKKDQFETEAEYQQRLARALAPLQDRAGQTYVLEEDCPCTYLGAYDAERGLWESMCFSTAPNAGQGRPLPGFKSCTVHNIATREGPRIRLSTDDSKNVATIAEVWLNDVAMPPAVAREVNARKGDLVVRIKTRLKLHLELQPPRCLYVPVEAEVLYRHENRVVATAR